MSAIKPVTQVQHTGEYATLMNTDTQGTGTLPAPRSYMVIGGRLAQVTRGQRVGYAKYEWTIVGTGRTTLVAYERPTYTTFTYEQDAALRKEWE